MLTFAIGPGPAAEDRPDGSSKTSQQALAQKGLLCYFVYGEVRMKNSLIAVIVVLVAGLAVLSLGGAGMMFGYGGYGMMGPWMMGRYGYPYGYGFNPVGSILSLVFSAMAIAGVVLLVIWFIRRVGVSSLSPESPLEILKSRYARGEITKEQYEAMKADLQ